MFNLLAKKHEEKKTGPNPKARALVIYSFTPLDISHVRKRPTFVFKKIQKCKINFGGLTFYSSLLLLNK